VESRPDRNRHEDRVAGSGPEDPRLAAYAQHVGPARARQTLAVVRRYLAWGGTAADSQLAAYAEHLHRAGYQPGTIDWQCRAIRAFWRAVGERPPANPVRREPAREWRPALAPAVVRTMIAAARAGEVSDGAAAYLAAATLYGCRHVELRRLADPAFRDLAHERVYIEAAKHSWARWVWCPPAVHPWMAQWPRLTPRGGYVAFAELCAVAQVEAPGPLGWHSLRRALAQGLLDAGVPLLALVRFLRWQSGPDIPGAAEAIRYTRPTVVIGATTTVVPDAGTRAFDAAVWDAHPFLPAWTGP
jgi:hypothetical protein